MGSSSEPTKQDGECTQEHLFQLTMDQEWNEVAKVYADDRGSWACTAKLTNAEETALHVAISSYCSDHPRSYLSDIKKMIKSIPPQHLNMPTNKGNTILHLAAAVGSQALCKFIASRKPDLMEARNHRKETPLFVAALHGNLGAFICLHEAYSKTFTDQERRYLLCRRDDGNTILHTAITGEHFELAYQILCDYKELCNHVNVAGERPLYVLATKPNVFKSSTHLGPYDSVIYYCMLVENLKKHKCVVGEEDDNNSDGGLINYPENYRTCVSILNFLWRPIIKSFKAGNLTRNTDEEKQQAGQKKSKDTCPQDEGEGDARYYPPNYKTCILLFKFGVKIILTVLGVGFNRIKKIQEKKQQHVHAVQIMKELIEYESSYKYSNDGQEPANQNKPLLHDEIAPPESPPDHDQHTNAEQNDGNKQTSGDQNEPHMIVKNDAALLIAAKIETPEMAKKIIEALPAAMLDVDNNEKGKLVKKDTSILRAAKLGIPEMVKKILKTFPIAFQDLDSNGKNILMLAAENRHTSVFNYLLTLKLPKYVYHQVDNNGNSILHLAAMLGELHPWRIPGAALQMQWEIKWYKHVKHSIPRPSFAHSNNEGETARKIFTKTHEPLVEKGTNWLIKTSESCSVVAALIATVAFATSATVPGGLNQNSGYPIMENQTAFDIFSISSLIALCLSVTALVFFLAIITSRCQERDFKSNLPTKLLMGLTALFASITAMLVSFCAGHTFILRQDIRVAAAPIYAAACIPVSLFALAQLPLYFDLVWANCVEVPLRSYKVYHH